MTETVNKSDKGEYPEVAILKDENARLEKQLTNMFNVLTMTSELALSLEFDEVISNILNILVVYIGSRRHSIGLIDNAGVLKIIASRFGDDEVDFEHAVLEKEIVKKSLKSKDIYALENVTDKMDDDVVACIPLQVKGKIIGIIVINELLSHKKGFNEDDKELFKLLSSHAGYAIIASKTYEKSIDTTENRDREITKLYDISSLVSSAIDINDVMNIIADAISDLIICDIIAIMLFDEEEKKLRLRYSMGLEPGLLGNYLIDLGDGVSGKVFKEKKPILIKNAAHEIRYKDVLATDEAKLYSGSILSVPIMVNNHSIGAITISKFKGGNLLDVPEKKVLTTLAAQAAIGINNAYLYEKQEKELVNVSNLFIATNQLHSTVDIDEIYKIANELIVDFIGAKQFFIMLKDSTGETLTVALAHGHELCVDNFRVNVGEGIIGKSVENGTDFILSKGEHPPSAACAGEEFQIFACIPLKLKDKILGVIVINELLSQKSAFVQFDRELFSLMAHHTATAIIRAQLYAKSEQKETSLYDLSRLLTVDYDLKKSLNITLKLIHKSVKKVKSAVFIYGEGESDKCFLFASDGYDSIDIDLKSIEDKKEAIPIFLYHEKKKIGVFIVEPDPKHKVPEKDIDVLKVTGNLMSNLINNDKNFSLSKKLAIILNKEKAQSRAIVKGVADGLLVTDLEMRVLQANPVVENIFGFKEKSILGDLCEKVINNKTVIDLLSQTLKEGQVEKKIKIAKNGSDITIYIKGSMVVDEKNKPFGVVTIMRDITKEIEADKMKAEFVKKLKKISITDELTSVYNRRYFEQQLKREFVRSERYGKDFSCVMIDVDHFKNINDTYGHTAGDNVLICIVKVLNKVLRTSDLLARYGGEEFIIILSETDLDHAALAAERLRSAVETETFTIDGNNSNLTISLGICAFSSKGVAKPEDMIKYADKSLYVAKEQGRNKVVSH